jgi:hypothetical protein
MAFTRFSGIDLDRFRQERHARMYAAADRVESPRLPMHPEAQVVVDDGLVMPCGTAALELVRKLGRTMNRLIGRIFFVGSQGLEIVHGDHSNSSWT